jgi:hypothetical protein
MNRESKIADRVARSRVAMVYWKELNWFGEKVELRFHLDSATIRDIREYAYAIKSIEDDMNVLADKIVKKKYRDAYSDVNSAILSDKTPKYNDRGKMFTQGIYFKYDITEEEKSQIDKLAGVRG